MDDLCFSLKKQLDIQRKSQERVRNLLLTLHSEFLVTAKASLKLLILPTTKNPGEMAYLQNKILWKNEDNIYHIGIFLSVMGTPMECYFVTGGPILVPYRETTILLSHKLPKAGHVLCASPLQKGE